MRRIRSALALLTLMAAMVVATALVVPHVVDTAGARQAVSRWLSNSLGREVVIAGEMRFTLLPVVGFVIQDLAVAGAEGLGDETVLRVKQATVAVAPLPLFKRQVVFERIHLRSARLDLVRDPGGRTNWDWIAGEQPRPELAVGAPGAAALLQFEQVIVEDGTLRVRDAVSGVELLFSRIAFQRRGREDHRFKLETRVECRRSPVPGLDGLGADFRLAGRARVVPSENRYAIEDARLNLSLNRVAVQAPPLATVEAMVCADAAAARLNLEDLRIVGRGGILSGTLTGRLNNHRPSLSGRVWLKIEMLDALLSSMGISWPPEVHLPRGADLNLELSVTPDKLALTRIQGQIDSIAMDAKLVLTAGSPLVCQVQMNTGVLDLDAYLPSAGQEPGEMAPPRPSWLAMDFAFAAEALSWRGLRIDGAHLQMRYAPNDGATIQAAGGCFAGGDWELAGTLAPADDTLVAALTLAARNVDVARLRLLPNASARARGRVDIEADVQAAGSDWQTLYRQAAGRIRIASRRPFQLAAFPETKASGWLEARLDADRNFGLALELQVPAPALQIALKTEGLWDDEALALANADTSLTLEAPFWPGPDSRLDLDGRLSVSIRDGKAALHRIHLSALGLKAKGGFDLDLGKDRPTLSASLDVLPVALRPWLRDLGLELPILADTEAPGQAALKTDLTCNGRCLSLRGLELTVDDTHLRGIADITAFDPLRVRFMLDADRIDLDRYWPAGEDGRRSGKRIHQEPLDRLPMDIAGTLTVEQLRVVDLEAGNLFARVALDPKALRLDSIRLNLYEGTAEGSLSVAIDGSDPVWQTRVTVADAALKRPLEIIFGLPVLSGRADVSATLIGRKTTAASPAVGGLDGQVELRVRNGAIHGVQIVPDVIASSQKPHAPAEARTDATPFQPFDAIEGRWTLGNGVAVTDNHRLKGPQLAMTAVGRVDFVRERLDAVLETDISGIPVVYYALEGPFGDIGVKMDRSRLVIDTTAQIVNSPFKLGQGTLGAGVDILDRGSRVIGDDSGVQQVGQGAMTVGKGVLEMGKGVLELHRGGDSLQQGARSVGQGVYGLGKGAIGVGQDVLDAGVKALEGFGKGLERLFGGQAANPEVDPPAQTPHP